MKNSVNTQFLMKWGSSFMRRRVWWMLPSPLITWFLARQNIARVNAGYRLVPEDELEEKYIKCLQHLPANQSGDYLEFGVFCGSSMACMFHAISKTGHDDMRLFGFDSFKGLPEVAGSEGWRPREYCMNLDYTRKFLAGKGVDCSRTFLIDGWFSETLTAYTRTKYGIVNASIVMIDCDIYSSSKEALDFVGPLLNQTSFIIFDDWNSLDNFGENLGQKKAFPQFLSENPQFTAIPFDNYGKNGQIFLIERNLAVTEYTLPVN